MIAKQNKGNKKKIRSNNVFNMTKRLVKHRISLPVLVDAKQIVSMQEVICSWIC